MTKLVIDLRPSEKKALQRLAYDERRKIDAQAAHLVCCELARRSLWQLPSEPAVELEVANAGNVAR